MATDADFCNCCDLPMELCGRAAAARQEAEDKNQRTMMINAGWFAAKFPGNCRECGEGFASGDLIKGGPGYGHRCRKYYAECCYDKVGVS